MPLYDCVLLAKPHVSRQDLINLICRIGKHVCARNGVVTEIKSFGTVQLGYGVKKLDGRFYEGDMMQMTMMATPNMNKELHYLNKEDLLLRWLLVKHRDTSAWMERDRGLDSNKFNRRNYSDAESLYAESKDDYDDDDDDIDEDNETEYDEKTEEQ